MKVYTRIVLDMTSGQVVSAESFDYEGPVAAVKGPKPTFGKEGSSSVASQIVGGELRGPLSGALKDSVINNPFLDQASSEFQAAQSGIRGMYGARGLANSGIAVKGEQDALSDIATKAQANRATQLTGILGTATGTPNVLNPTMATPRGFMGLK